MRYPCRRGFTLIELVVVLFVAGLAIALVSVSIGRSRDRTVVRSDRRALYMYLKQARDQSILNRAPVTFVIAEDGGSFGLEAGGKTLGKTHRLGGGLRLEGEPMVFYPKGNSTGGHITLMTPSGKAYPIDVDPVTGTAKVAGRF